MNLAPIRVMVCCLVGPLALGNTACSLLFVHGPPDAKPRGVTISASECTSSKAAPVVDTIIGALQVASTAYAVAAPDRVYQDPKQPLSRGANVAIGVGLSALFVGSATYGYRATSRCERYKRLGIDDEMIGDQAPEAREEPPRTLPPPSPKRPPTTEAPRPAPAHPAAEPTTPADEVPAPEPPVETTTSPPSSE